MAKTQPEVKKELPQLFCGGCRTWFETQERHNMFVSVDGVSQPLTIWLCPTCRGAGPVEGVKPAEPAKTQADISKDERIGPRRRVVSFKLNPSGRSGRAALECGHEVTTSPKMKEERCKKCRPSTVAK